MATFDDADLQKSLLFFEVNYRKTAKQGDFKENLQLRSKNQVFFLSSAMVKAIKKRKYERNSDRNSGRSDHRAKDLR